VTEHFIGRMSFDIRKKWFTLRLSNCTKGSVG
jgi:hypothetical protein